MSASRFPVSMPRQIALDDNLVPPHGGRLVQSFVPAAERMAHMQYAQTLPHISLSLTELHDLEMLACGAYSPLGGFMDGETYKAVCSGMRLTNGLPWGLPVTLAVSGETAGGLKIGSHVSLFYGSSAVALMTVSDVYPWDPESEAASIWDNRHLDPVALERTKRGAEFLVGGPIAFFAARMAPHLMPSHMWPRETRSMFAMRGWRRMSTFHMQNPWQRTHEYQLKCALESSDGLLLHQTDPGFTAHGALPEKVVAEASHILLKGYFPGDRVLVNPAPLAMNAQHPRAAVQHAILAQNYGCDHIFFAEDNTSHREGDAPGDLQAVFAAACADGLRIVPAFLEPAFHCEACAGVATGKSCPHDASLRIFISEAEIHEKLIVGEGLPAVAARPDVARALSRGISMTMESGAIVKRGNHIFPHIGEVSRELRQTIAGHKACILWMTGLSGSGKSTIAHRLERELLMSGHRVFVLDGDTLRSGLNKDLGFSDDARRENLRRAGEVAKVMLEAGLIVIASFISPFRSERENLREICGQDFYEVYVEASLEDCEQRDPKGLYKRARAGIIPQFTGISSPYEHPENPELRLNTSVYSLEDCVRQSMEFISKAGVTRSGRRDGATSRNWPVGGVAVTGTGKVTVQ